MATRKTETDHDDEPRGFASPPCFMHEVDPAYMGLAPEGTKKTPPGGARASPTPSAKDKPAAKSQAAK